MMCLSLLPVAAFAASATDAIKAGLNNVKEGHKNFSLCRDEINKKEYLSELLFLFYKEGLNISHKELDMLLLQWEKTDNTLNSKSV